MSTTTSNLRLVGTFGSNKVMAGELSRLVRRAYDDVRVPAPQKKGPGCIVYPFEPRMAAVAMRYHRTSARVLWELYRSHATKLEPLYADVVEAVKKDQRSWFRAGTTLSVSAFSVGNFAAGERQVVGTIKNALCDGVAAQGSQLTVAKERPDILIDVRMFENELSVSLDLAGRPMHQRGYRHASGPAPLREDVAALLLMLARHDSRTEMLLDPMAGAGTIGIEAASMASARPLWCSGRKPLGERYAEIAPYVKERPRPLFGDTTAYVELADTDARILELARTNAETAGVEPQFLTHPLSFQQLRPADVMARGQVKGKSGGLILSNPPFGQRLDSNTNLSGLYRELGQWCRQFAGWRAGFLVSNDAFIDAFGMRPVLQKPVSVGPLEALFCLYEL